MSRTIEVLENLGITAVHGTMSEIHTKPIALGPYDHVTVMFGVPYMFQTGGATGQVTYVGEVSNDLSTWVQVATLTENATSPTVVYKKLEHDVNGVYLRFLVTHQVTGSGGEVGGAGVCLSVDLKHK